MSPSEFLKSFAGLVMLAGLVVLGFIAFFLAWWIVMAGVAVGFLYLALWRLLGRKPPEPSGEPRVIEGKYRVEKEED